MIDCEVVLFSSALIRQLQQLKHLKRRAGLQEAQVAGPKAHYTYHILCPGHIELPAVLGASREMHCAHGSNRARRENTLKRRVLEQSNG